MASKGPRSKLDHETRARRQKALEAPREPRRPKTHWDHVLEEMVWLSKDFESERKWKLAQAKKVALRASKGMLDQATKGERKLKEEEQRLRKVAVNISKDVKKFWIKIEKLVLYKHQMELDEKKKKALDKQLEFLLGQTERYSTMLAENLVDSQKPVQHSAREQPSISSVEVYENDSKALPEVDTNTLSDIADIDEDYSIQSADELEDDERGIEEDEAHITEKERKEELEALHTEIDLPLEDLLKRYSAKEGNEEPAHENEFEDPAIGNDLRSVTEVDSKNLLAVSGRRCGETNGDLTISEVETSRASDLSKVSCLSDKVRAPYDFNDEQEDGDFVIATGEELDDESTLLEEEELAKMDLFDIDEIALLQKESEVPVEELLARYKKECNYEEVSVDESEDTSSLSENHSNSPPCDDIVEKQQAFSTCEDVKHDEHNQVVTSLAEIRVEGPETKIEVRDSDSRIEDAAAAARSAQPTGNTFSTTNVRTKFPFLIKHPLREYQHIGLDWLVTMYEKRLNGILADEMGLGKTIMTIALLAHLACEKGIWGPHLIVVPTSVMLNWETEFLKWCPAFKILTYFGSAKERKFKRQGWMKPNSFHVCITTYRLVIQDSKIFKRKKWKYLILDEAHLIKNWKSQRWQTLLNFNSKRRILLTGTPLQNDLMELWSLMHFLMPHIFQSHQEFKDWFSNPISGMVEGQEKVNKEVLDRLHNVLRPFILRRLKRDVEKQLPLKVEHVIYCRLSRRQRNLYEDFIASSETQATLASSNFFGMISVIMQLRKVCNHPDLFEGRPILSSFDMSGIDFQLSSSVCSMLSPDPFSTVDLTSLGFLFTHLDFCMTSWETDEVKSIATPSNLIIGRAGIDELEEIGSGSKNQSRLQETNIFEEIRNAILEERLKQVKERAESIAWWNSLRCHKRPVYSTNLRELVTVKHNVYDVHRRKADRSSYLLSSKLVDIVLSPVEQFQRMFDLIESFMFAVPAARAPPPVCWCSKTGSSVFLHPNYKEKCSQLLLPLLSPIRPAIVRGQVYFPDRRLIQFDCGKLQELALLLRKLKSEGHRALIFTQMTKMLDVLEAFINLYGYTYMRLDGSTQPEERQTLMQRFNTNPKIFLFILSTRSGGVGINLVGADTVIFYDSDWNPAMDQQAQDRCHRIGQTREVHIYRLISQSTIEENILKKANQKRTLDDLVIQSGSYNTEFFKKLDPLELFSGLRTLPTKNMQKEKTCNNGFEVSVSNADVEAALEQAEDEADYMALKKVEQEEAVDNQEFTEEAIGRLEDDDLINEDDMKGDEFSYQSGRITSTNKESGLILNRSEANEERALNCKEDDVDMLADVKQMAAAAVASGQEISAFENQLRPIDRYAIRFLELWDPVVNKAAMESQVRFEETEWELDRIEKYKDEMEAEIDDDEEPFVYERWDADFATEAYRQQVEALAQHQLMVELENEAREKEMEDDENCDSMKDEMPSDPRPKSKKKPKKTKFKSLKKGSLASASGFKEEESPLEAMSIDEDITYHGVGSCSDMTSTQSSVHKKRKVPEAEKEKAFKKFKKLKKASPSPSGRQDEESIEQRPSDSNGVELEQKSAISSRMGGKISLTSMPIKRVLMIKPEKLKKGNIWSRDCVPSPDYWLPQEDAILCAIVHEYGLHWSLVSDALYGMTAGGFYRGRYRHPVHCCERFRELVQRYVLCVAENPNKEKISNTGSGKSLLKVTEDNIRMLLHVASELPDTELLLQKHFTALLVSVWRTTSHIDHRPRQSSWNSLFYAGKVFNPSVNQISGDCTRQMKMTNLGLSSKLLANALHEVGSKCQDKLPVLSKHREEIPSFREELDVTLEFQRDEDEPMIPWPPVLRLSLFGSEPSPSVDKDTEANHHFKSSQNLAEYRFRTASRTCFEGTLAWASSVFPTNEVKGRSASKAQSLGKHKLVVSDPIKPSKSKLRKTLMEHSDMSNPMCQPVPNLKFDLTPPHTQATEINNLDDGYTSSMDKELSFGSDTFEPVPHEYVADFTYGLDDYSLFSESIDIG